MSTLRDMSEPLARIEAPGAFATRRTTSADDLHLEVKGVGRITGLDLDQVTRRIQRLPGVDGVAVGNFVPWRDVGTWPRFRFAVEGYTPAISRT